jgi:hypothetical protein
MEVAGNRSVTTVDLPDLPANDDATLRPCRFCPGEFQNRRGGGSQFSSGRLLLRFARDAEAFANGAITNDLAILADWLGLPHGVDLPRAI